MEECMRDSMKKLALWYTRTFKPIMTHDELEPIIAILGFVPAAAAYSNGASASSTWKEYVYSASCPQSQGPKPRLPYPRIDGLHIYTYRAFLDSINFYLQMNENDISDLFHIRGMPLQPIHDRNKKWRRMEEDDSVYVYREGTLDQASCSMYHLNKNAIVVGDAGHNSTTVIRKKSSVNNNINASASLVPLKDIII